jgi:signal transduction histidine kinase
VAAVSDEMDRAGTLNRTGTRGPHSGDFVPLDRLFRLAVAIGVAVTVLVFMGGIHGHGVAPAADLVLDTVAAVVCIALTTLAWARYRERRVVAAAYHAAAFMALSIAYGIAVLISLQHAASLDALAPPDNVQVLVFAVARLAAAVLFVIGGVFTQRRTYGWNPAWILVAPTLAVVVAALVGKALDPPPDALQIVTYADATRLPHITPFGAVIGLATSVLFFVGAWVSRNLWHAGRSVIDGWIAVGLVFAGFAELQWTLYPSAHPGQVSTADVLRLVCSACLMAGLASAFRASQRELRTANVDLEQLRDSEVQRAALEERTRLARELHDGLAQDLWLAKLRIGELVGREDLSAEARRAAESGLAAIDVGLGDAREAVATLRSPAHSDSGFCSLVRQTVEDYGDRFGIRVEFTFEGEHTARIAPRTQAEILRITQEALTNVARHADATLVGVYLALTDDQITLRVADNGHGFDVAAVGSKSYGLASMRERAAIIGGQVRIASRPETGTRVILTAPFAPSTPFAPFAPSAQPVPAEPA